MEVVGWGRGGERTDVPSSTLREPTPRVSVGCTFGRPPPRTVPKVSRLSLYKVLPVNFPSPRPSGRLVEWRREVKVLGMGY